MLSGILNALLVSDESFATPTVLWCAGFPYGVVTGLYFIRTMSVTREALRLTLWTILSTISYIIGVRLTLSLAYFDFFPNPTAVNYALGGFAGALVLTIAFHFIFRNMSMLRHLMIIIAGALLPFVLFSLFGHIKGFPGFFGILYVSWQTIITVLLGTEFLQKKTTLQ